MKMRGVRGMRAMIALLLYVLTVHSKQASASSSSQPPPSSNQFRRPPFLSHVDREQLQGALQSAKQQHNQAISEALENYPLDDTLQAEMDLVNSLPLQHYKIEAPATLPDFADELSRDVFVTEQPLLTREECQQVLKDAQAYFDEHHNGIWTTLPSGQYDVAGFWIKNIPAVHKWFCQVVRTKLTPLLAKTFSEFAVGNNIDDNSESDHAGLADAITQLCVDNAYLFKYTPETGRRTDVHTDSGCLSFTIALNDAAEYDGGGTWFDGLRRANSDNENDTTPCDPPILEMHHAGQVTIRPGGVKHCGNAVERGERYIIGGFCLHKKKIEVVRQIMAQAQQSGNLGDYVKNIEAALCLNPQFDPAYNLLAVAIAERAGDNASNNNVIAKQVEVLDYCLQQVHPYAGDVAYALGSLYKDNLNDLDKARVCFEKCLRADSLDVEAMAALMMVAAAAGDATQEAKYAQRIIDSGVASDKILGQAYCNLGVLAGNKENNVEQEMHYYQKSLELNPDRFAPRYSLASALAQQQKWLPAAREYQTALALASDQMTPEQRVKTLQHLYTCTAHLVQAQVQSAMQEGKPQPSREEMMEQFQDIMGKSNFDELVALRQQQQQKQQ